MFIKNWPYSLILTTLMDIVTLLPSRRQFWRLALSLFNSMSVYRKLQYQSVSPINFDIDVETGFLPRRPLPQLPKPFGIWETTLCEAKDVLSLGEDEFNTAVEKEKNGELWRTRVKSVSESVV
jgi:indoleamine 2,3-dioxygenase